MSGRMSGILHSVSSELLCIVPPRFAPVVVTISAQIDRTKFLSPGCGHTRNFTRKILHKIYYVNNLLSYICLRTYLAPSIQDDLPGFGVWSFISMELNFLV